MTTRKTSPKPAAVIQAEQRATVPKRQVIQHAELLRAELHATHIKANNSLMAADASLSAAADSRDADIALANQRYEAIRAEIDAERADILLTMDGIEAALAKLDPPSSVVAMAAE